MSSMTIGKTAQKAGVGVETIRFYEREGLVDRPGKPAVGGFRIYPTETIGRIRFIRQAQEIGFSLRDIKEILSLRADPNADCSHVRERAAAKLDEVNQKIERLTQIRSALTELVAACPGSGALRACSILEVLTEAEEGGNGVYERNERSR